MSEAEYNLRLHIPARPQVGDEAPTAASYQAVGDAFAAKGELKEAIESYKQAVRLEEITRTTTPAWATCISSPRTAGRRSHTTGALSRPIRTMRTPTFPWPRYTAVSESSKERSPFTGRRWTWSR